MTANILSNYGLVHQGRAPQVYMNVTLCGCANYAVPPDLQSNRNMARVGWCRQDPNKVLPPATWEDVTGMLSREHVKHKYKRPGCRIQKDDWNLLGLFW